MRAVFARELVVIARRPALAGVIVTYVALLAVFVFAWEDGVPVAGRPSLYEQTRLVQWGILAACLTWVSVRCAAPERGDDLVMVSSVTALRPSSLIAGKAAALFAALTLVAVTGLPVAIMAQQTAAVPASDVLRDLAFLPGLPLLVSAVTLSWVVLVGGRLRTWLGASGSVGLVLVVLWRWRPAGLDPGLACALAGLALVAWLAGWSDRSLQYLADRKA